VRILVFVFVLLAALLVGAEEATYLFSDGDIPVPTAANGYVQEVRELADGTHEAHVSALLAPIGATGTYAQVVAEGVPVVPAGFALPPRLKAALRPELEAWEAATMVLEWAADNLVLDVSDNGPQDAFSVLERGRGRCSGLANSTAALLLTAGFEARTVSGLLVGEDEAVPHRWLECRLPGAGWVPTDPTLGIWIITSRHVVFSDTVVQLPVVQKIRGEGAGLDGMPRLGSRLLRPNQGADLVCRISGGHVDPPLVAILRNSSGDIRRALLDPEAHFSGLLPGKWTLEVEAAGSVVERRALILRSGTAHSYVVQHPDGEQPREEES
jgi:hypothetical protein